MSNLDNLLLDALKAVRDPHTGTDFVSHKQIKNLRVQAGRAEFELHLGYPARSQLATL